MRTSRQKTAQDVSLPPYRPADKRSGHIGGQFGWIAGGRILAAFVQAATLVLLARWVGLDTFGILSAYLAVAVIVQSITDLGIPVYVIRERAANGSDALISQALRVNNLTVIAVGLIMAAVTAVLTASFGMALLQMAPLIVWAAADRNADVWLGVVLADGDARVNSASILFRRLASLSLFAASHLLGAPDVLAYSMSAAASSMVASVWARKYVARRLTTGSPHRLSVAHVIKAARPFWVNSVATQMRNADVLLCGLLAGPAQAGFYAAASRTTSPLRILPTSLAAVLVPAAAKQGAGNLRRLRTAVITVMAVITTVYVVLVLVAPVGIPLVLGPEFVGAVLPFQLVVGGLVLGAVASISGAILQGVGGERRVAQAAVVSTLVCLGGVAGLSHEFGAVGAAWSLIGSYLFQAVALVAVLWNVRRTTSMTGEIL